LTVTQKSGIILFVMPGHCSSKTAADLTPKKGAQFSNREKIIRMIRCTAHEHP
jgi:hypothetical protein